MKTYHSPLLLCILCQLAFVCLLSAQSTAKPYYHGNTATATSRVATTGYSGTGSNIDVVYHRAEWRINPDSTVKAISGSVTTYFVTTVANVSTITFDLRQSAFNNTNLKIKYHGTMLPSASRSISSTNVLSINLGVSLPAEQLDSVTIYYGGTPPAVSGAAEGFQLATDATTGQKYIYTLSESYEDRDWWPCKADMQDKIDSMDIIVSTPWVGADTFWVATNGVLADSAISGNSRYFTFKNRYPMASYLVCLSVARYNRYYTSVNVGGTTVPVAYYLFRGKTAATYNNIITAMNKVNEAVVALSAKFGDYPFKKEKHGFYEGLGGAGGMEHQTFSAIASNALTSISTLTHELMHQWFGDKVTFANWSHLWLAEGFARYSESLVAELVAGTGLSAYSERNSCKTSTLGSTLATTSLVIPSSSMTTSNGIWGGSYGSAVYEKGAMVISMLRKLAGDQKFFLACRNYLNDPALAYRSAVTDDLKNHFEAVLNYDLDPFFNDYASTTGKGNPAYDISWGNAGTGINIELTTQRRSNTTGVTYFRTPIVLRINNSDKSKDTTVVIYDQNGQLSYAGNGIFAPVSGKVLGYTLSFVPASIEVDPNAETLVRGQDGVAAGTNRVGQSTVAKAPRLNTAPTTLPPVIVLPITIIDFKGIKKEEGNYLSLLLTTTSDNISLYVERSENGVDFSVIGQMVKQNGVPVNISYTYLDKATHTAKDYYYRVKTVDEKGIVKYSKIIVLSGSGQMEGVRLMPNPANDHVVVVVPKTSISEYIDLAIVNSSGAVIERRKFQKSVANIRLDVKHLPTGNYAVVLNDDKQQRWAKTFSVIR